MLAGLLRVHRSQPLSTRWPAALFHKSSSRFACCQGSKIIGISREVYSKWERRAPLCPDHVRDLVKQGYNVLVQPSHRRTYSNDEYEAAGATITEDLSPACLILAVKQTPIDDLLPNKTYMMFSHTIKAQEENMLLLDACLEKNIRLVDYECITETGERASPRLVAFGRFAGIAGMIDILQGLGQTLLAQGFNTPFLNAPQSFMYHDLVAAKSGILRVGQQIEWGLPSDLSPLVFGFTGSGKVSKGAQEIFTLLPHKWVDAKDLPSLIPSLQGRPEARRTLYGTIIGEDLMVEPIKGGAFDRQEYRQYPERYRPIFDKTIAPYLSVLIHGIFWDHRYPRLLTRNQLRELTEAGRCRLLAISDISCDIGGSLEFLSHSTLIEKPYYNYYPTTGKESDMIDGQGVVIGAVDILPSELPREASKAFGDALLPLLPSLASCGDDRGLADLPPPLQGAVITSNGQLTPQYRFIDFLRKEKEREKKLKGSMKRTPDVTPVPHTTLTLTGHLFDSGTINKTLDVIEGRGGSFHIVEVVAQPNQGSARNLSTVVLQVEAPTEDILKDVVASVRTLMSLLEGPEAKVVEQGKVSSTTSTTSATVISETPRKVLVLGAGRVAGAAVEYLGRSSKRRLTVVGAMEKEACRVAQKAKWTKALVLDVAREQEVVRSLIKEADIVLSLLPAPLHPQVAQHCVHLGKDMVTSSYVSEEMRALHDQAETRGITILNEVGLDPGMDHLSACRIIDSARQRGGEVTSFISLCGGLPACEVANNPFVYKFSWSPRGVLSAAQQSAVFIRDGVRHDIDAGKLLTAAEPVSHGWPTLRLEFLPNRNSLVYAKLYKIPQAHTVFRGTLRYQGWSDLMFGCKALGLLDSQPLPSSVPATWGDMLGALVGARSSGELEACMRAKLEGAKVREPGKVVEALRWLGMMEKGREAGSGDGTVIDAFGQLLEEKLTFGPGERDMVLMSHEVDVAFEDQGVLEKHCSSLMVFGDETDSAMARTVGLTAAMATELVLDRGLTGSKEFHGVITPLSKTIYNPLLDKLEKEGLAFEETVTKVATK